MQTKKQTTFLFLLFTFAFTLSGKAQAKDSLLNQLAKKWKNAKAYTLKVAGLMPEEQYHFKPTPNQMTFGEQLLHIAQNIDWLSYSYLFAGKQNPSDGKSAPKLLSKQSIINTVSAAYDSATVLHYSLYPNQLGQVVPFFAGQMSRRQILILMHDHQTHHVGQLIVYLRLKGIKPPNYIGW